MKIIPCVLLFSALCVTDVAHATDVLHMADMQALAKANAWPELLAKATNVPPSERDASWNELVGKAAAARVNDSALTDRDVVIESEGLLTAYPALAQNRAFMDARGKRGVIAFEGCFRDAYDLSECLKRARAFVAADPKNATLAKDMGMAVAHATSPKTAATDFFHQAVSAARAGGEAQAKLLKDTCASDELSMAASGAFVNLDADNAVVPKARELVFDWCWAHMDHDKIAKAALDSDRGFVNACPGLLAKKALQGTREKKCKDAVAKK